MLGRCIKNSPTMHLLKVNSPSIVTHHQRAVPVNTLVVVVTQVSHCPGNISYQLGGGAKPGAWAKIQSCANCRQPTRYKKWRLKWRCTGDMYCGVALIYLLSPYPANHWPALVPSQTTTLRPWGENRLERDKGKQWGHTLQKISTKKKIFLLLAFITFQGLTINTR